MIEARPTAYSRVTLSRIMTSQDVNLYGTVHGGAIMKFVDDAAGASAARHCGFNAVTVAIDEIVLMVPVRVGRPRACQGPGELDRQHLARGRRDRTGRALERSRA